MANDGTGYQREQHRQDDRHRDARGADLTPDAVAQHVLDRRTDDGAGAAGATGRQHERGGASHSVMAIGAYANNGDMVVHDRWRGPFRMWKLAGPKKSLNAPVWLEKVGGQEVVTDTADHAREIAGGERSGAVAHLHEQPERSVLSRGLEQESPDVMGMWRYWKPET